MTEHERKKQYGNFVSECEKLKGLCDEQDQGVDVVMSLYDALEAHVRELRAVLEPLYNFGYVNRDWQEKIKAVLK